jgi:catechol 2,3-dioxygenase-like lactoylglutathione lyase family enzyme
MTRPALTEELSKYVLPAAQFDGLCLEVRDAERAARFWSAALGSKAHDVGPGQFRINPGPGRPAREILRITEVPEPPRDSHRVHLDLRLPGAEPDHLIAAGAQLVSRAGRDPWHVLTDPEGTFFCAYPAVDRRPAGIFELVVKSRDAYAQAAWWSDVLGGEVVAEGEAAAVQSAPEFPWDFMLFDPVPEPKVGRNRLHWHLNLRDREPSALIAAGATIRREPPTRDAAWVLADPEGNEFCAFPNPR